MAKCKFQLCDKSAIFQSGFCWDHIEDKAAFKSALKNLAENSCSFKGANLSKTDLRGLNLTHADLSGCNLSRADLSDANLLNANLKNAELVGANLSNCDLTGANLEGCDLTKSNLDRSRLWHANLEDATLIEASLIHCDLWNARLPNIRLWRTDISHAISLSKNNFYSKPNSYRINEKGVFSAEEAYRELKRYFIAHGRYNDASWASFKEKTMETLFLKEKRSLGYLPNLIMGLLCGYGERPLRIVASSFIVILFYGLTYFALNSINYTASPSYNPTLADCLYYSIVTFTTVGYGDFIPKSVTLFRFLAASEAFIGVFMIGLFIFTLGRAYSAR